MAIMRERLRWLGRAGADTEKILGGGGVLDQGCQCDSSVMIGWDVDIAFVRPVCLSDLVGANVKRQRNLFESQYHFPITVKCVLTTDL